MFKLANVGKLATANLQQQCKHASVPFCQNTCFCQPCDINTRLFEWLFLYNHKAQEKKQTVKDRKSQTLPTKGIQEENDQSELHKFASKLSNIFYNENGEYITTPKYKRISPDFLKLINKHTKDFNPKKGGSFVWSAKTQGKYSVPDSKDSEEELSSEYNKTQRRSTIPFEKDTKDTNKSYDANYPTEPIPIPKLKATKELTPSIESLLHETLEIEKQNIKLRYKKPTKVDRKKRKSTEIEEPFTILTRHMKETMDLDSIANTVYGINFYGNPNAIDNDFNVFKHLNLNNVAHLLSLFKSGKTLSAEEMEALLNFVKALGALDASFLEFYMNFLIESNLISTDMLNYLLKLIKDTGLGFDSEKLKLLFNALEKARQFLLNKERVEIRKAHEQAQRIEFIHRERRRTRRKASEAHQKSVNVYLDFERDPFGNQVDGYYQPWNVEIPFESFKAIYQMNSLDALEYLKTLTEQKDAEITDSRGKSQQYLKDKKINSIKQIRSTAATQNFLNKMNARQNLPKFRESYTKKPSTKASELRKHISFYDENRNSLRLGSQ